jgi:hypothetical protein
MSDYPTAKFKIGDKVSFSISGKIEGVDTTITHAAFVTRLDLQSDSEKCFILYGLTDDLCGPYYGGKGIQWHRTENQLTPCLTP